MTTLIQFLFPSKLRDRSISSLILSLRLLFGGLLMYHGMGKLLNYEALSSTFPDPMGFGNEVSLMLAIFAELFCSILFIAGLLYRLVLLPMIFTMGVAFFIIHGGDPFSSKELAFVYLAMFIIMYITGAGRYSVDDIIAKRLKTR